MSQMQAPQRAHPPVLKPERTRFARTLLYGPSGHGKTHLLGTAQEDPRTSPTLIVAFEPGEDTLAGLDVDVVRIRSWQDYNQTISWLKSGDHPYKSVGIDSLTETHFFALIQEATRRSNQAPGSTTDTIYVEIKPGDGDKLDPDMLQPGDYGKARIQIMKLIRGFRDLPMHVFFTALSKEETDAKEGIVKKPDLSGGLADSVQGIVSVVGYLALGTSQEGGVERVLVLKNYPKIRAKIRLPWGVTGPDEIYDPNIGKLLDVLQIPLETA